VRDGSGNTPARYGANTNLEQISDWLTKILVGVGLTQITKLPHSLSLASEYLGKALASGEAGGLPSASATGLAYASLIYFPTCGFLFSYLWSRLYLAGALAEADIAAQVARVEEKIDAQAKQAELDASALAKTARQLNPDDSNATMPEGELVEAIRVASRPVKEQVYHQAQQLRTRTWERDKPLMERTIPVFRGLAAGDPDNHRVHGQLGFALKDQRNPLWAEAEKELTIAIRLRNASGDDGWWHLYDFNRAVCRVMKDGAYSEGLESSPSTRAQVVQDLSVLTARESELLAWPTLADWMTLNHVTAEEVPGLALGD